MVVRPTRTLTSRALRLANVPSRGFHGSASLLEYDWGVTSATGSKVTSRSPFHIACTWLAPEPSNVVAKDIIRRLPRLDANRHKRLFRPVFLLTPAFAKYLEDDEAFLRPALQHIYGSFSHLKRVIECSTAVVSRLPDPTFGSGAGRQNHRSRHPISGNGHEGIALWIDSQKFFEDKVQPSTNTESDERLLRTVFLHPRKDPLRPLTSLEMRPANTLFVNGAQTTMYYDRWRTGTASSCVERETKRELLRSLEFFLSEDHITFDAPLEALTLRRKIVTSMGNVIRQVEGHDGAESSSASAELEQKVPQYLARRSGVEGTLSVYALVSPGALVESQELNSLIEPTEGNIGSVELSSLQKALFAGAHLHRVTSGGGGWGKKQGLLSLDPAFDFSNVENTGSLDSFFEGSGPGPSGGAMNAVSPGDYVQFFASFHMDHQVDTDSGIPQEKEQETDVDTSTWDGLAWTKGIRQRFIVGSIPSQDDLIHDPAPDAQPSSSVDFIGIPNQFGMLSEGGLCLRRFNRTQVKAHSEPDLDPAALESGKKRFRQPTTSRVDVPYGTWKTEVENLFPAWKQAEDRQRKERNDSLGDYFVFKGPIRKLNLRRRTSPPTSTELLPDIRRVASSTRRK